MMPTNQRIIDALKVAGVDFDIEAFDPSKSFGGNGIDSLDVMSLFLTLEETYKVKFSEQEANSIKTPSELAVSLDQKLQIVP